MAGLINSSRCSRPAPTQQGTFACLVAGGGCRRAAGCCHRHRQQHVIEHPFLFRPLRDACSAVQAAVSGGHGRCGCGCADTSAARIVVLWQLWTGCAQQRDKYSGNRDLSYLCCAVLQTHSLLSTCADSGCRTDAERLAADAPPRRPMCTQLHHTVALALEIYTQKGAQTEIKEPRVWPEPRAQRT